MSRIKLIIFDLDGTLFNTKPGIVEAIKRTSLDEGFPRVSDKVYETFIGPPIEQSFSRVFGSKKEEAVRQGVLFRQYYGEDEYLFQTEEYDGMRQTLEALKRRGMKLALATYKKEWMALKICRHFGYDAFLDSIHGSDPDGKLTKGEIINICMEECGCTCDETLMVGDTDFDAKGARDAGTGFVGVTYGFGFTQKCDITAYEGAVAIDSPKELLEI
ncbi:MAG: HAD hydrolase-like protein [Lachnospiraceae bacterium]|nr:HAD hydrolase-like protein [Lachnospiraceae bacterium]